MVRFVRVVRVVRFVRVVRVIRVVRVWWSGVGLKFQSDTTTGVVKEMSGQLLNDSIKINFT